MRANPIHIDSKTDNALKYRVRLPDVYRPRDHLIGFIIDGGFEQDESCPPRSVIAQQVHEIPELGRIVQNHGRELRVFETPVVPRWRPVGAVIDREVAVLITFRSPDEE